MSLKHIGKLLQPKSVAVIGASNKANRPGNVVMRNLLQGDFDGPIMPVTIKYRAVNGVLAYKSIAELPIIPDLSIICTRAARVPEILQALGEKGCQNVIVIASGLADSHCKLDEYNNLSEQTTAIARQFGIRILGPNSIGLMVPGIGLNASYAHTAPLPGKIAFVSQSSAICTTILDWANPRGIGFSNFIALGDRADIDFGELIDYLGQDRHTRAILLMWNPLNRAGSLCQRLERRLTPSRFWSLKRAATAKGSLGPLPFKMKRPRQTASMTRPLNGPVCCVWMIFANSLRRWKHSPTVNRSPASA